MQRKLGGIKISHFKNTENDPIEKITPPKEVMIPMSMHIGAPAEPLVKKGDVVFVGTKIGEMKGGFSANVHSSVSGTVTMVRDFTTAMGALVKAVVIENDMTNIADPSVEPPVVNTKEEFLEAVKNSGLVGLGGASFPTHIKLSVGDKKVDRLIINAAECEPYLTSDYRRMIEDTDSVIDGIKAVMKYIGIEKCTIGIESNKPKAIELLSKYKSDGIDVLVLESKYPQGAEKVLIYNATGRVVMGGKLPIDVGVIVMNVTSVAFISHYLKTGMPLVSKWLTVDGGAVKTPKNIEVPIGTFMSDVIAFCDGYKEEVCEILMGGPMMGIAVPAENYPILKGNNGILALTNEQVAQYAESACIRCGRCASACPYDLMPMMLDKAFVNEDTEALDRFDVMLCMECGCCSYVCPARRKIATRNKLGKKLLQNKKARG